MQKNEEYTAKTSIGDRIIRNTRLDFVNKNKPRVVARKNLINYFLEEKKHNLTENQIFEFIEKSQGLSWYAIEESINNSSALSYKCEGQGLIEHKYLQYILYNDYSIYLTGKAENNDFAKEQQKENDIKTPDPKQESGCILM